MVWKVDAGLGLQVQTAIFAGQDYLLKRISLTSFDQAQSKPLKLNNKE